MKFIHIGDVHYGATPDSSFAWGNDRIREIDESLNQIIQIANQEAVDLLLIAGDLFHSQPLMKQLKEINYKLSQLKKTRVVIIAGNHDHIKAGSYYHKFQWNENVTMILENEWQTIYFEDIRTTIYGFSYHSQELPERRLDKILPNQQEGFHILLAHGGDDRHVPFNKDNLSKRGFDYVALGHIHKKELKEDMSLGYSGSLEPIDKNDIGDHGYIFGELGDNKNIQFISASHRKYIHLNIQVNSQMTNGSLVDTIQDRVSSEGKQHIYKIMLRGFRDPEIDFDMISLQQLGNIIEVIDETEPDYDFDAILENNKDNMIGMYIQRLRPLSEQNAVAKLALYYGIKAMLDVRGEY